MDYFMVQATESVIFEGNGARLVGHIELDYNWGA